MAKISNLQMHLKKTPKHTISVKIEYDLSFFETEVELNIGFWEFVAIVSTDGELNVFDYNQFINLWWLPDKGTDELINRIHLGTIKPDGEKLIHRSFEGSITNGGNISPKTEGLKPLVLVNPQITPHLVVGD